MKIRELPIEFSKKGVQFKQLVKTDEWYIYELSKDGSVWYEVFKYKLVNLHPLDQEMEIYDKKECYPSDESFGLWAWCCSDWKCVQKVMKREFGIDDFQI